MCIYIGGHQVVPSVGNGGNKTHEVKLVVTDQLENDVIICALGALPSKCRVVLVPCSYQGHSPAKFEAFIRKVRVASETGKGYLGSDGRPMLLIYNVSEWTEGGPGLQPNMQDGFGYLTALKSAICEQ